MSNPNQARKNAARKRRETTGESHQAAVRATQEQPEQPVTRWVEDPSLNAPDGHMWVRPVDDCPRCPCHTARVCESLLWRQADQPTNPDGSEYTKPCPCEQAEEARPYNVTVTVGGQQYLVGATFWCGSLRTERVWDGVAIELSPERPLDGTCTQPDEVMHPPVPLAMVLALPQAIGTAHADQPRAADPFGREIDGRPLEWVQFRDALHGGTRYELTGIHRQADPAAPAGQGRRPLWIPSDLASWSPREAQEWLASLEEDPDVTDAEFAAASNAVSEAILGTEPAPDDDGGPLDTDPGPAGPVRYGDIAERVAENGWDPDDPYERDER